MNFTCERQTCPFSSFRFVCFHTIRERLMPHTQSMRCDNLQLNAVRASKEMYCNGLGIFFLCFLVIILADTILYLLFGRQL